MAKQIRNAIELIPEGQRNLDLFIRVADLIDKNRDDFEAAINDIVSKYVNPASVSEEVVREVFYENGLPSIVDLFDAFETVDYNTILAFSGYILLFKGSMVGYRVVLDLVGFDYTVQEWWEQSPKAEPNTIKLDVNLDASEVAAPYQTFQNIKKFTREYIFPIIDPLGFDYTVVMADTAILCLCFAHPIYDGGCDEETIDESLLFSNTFWILEDELGGTWNIKVNALGTLQAFSQVADPSPLFAVTRPNLSVAQIKVDSSGSLYAVDADPLVIVDDNFYLTDRININQFLRVDDTNNIYTET